MECGIQMTLEEFMPEIFQEQTYGVSDSPVRTSLCADTEGDFKETVQACFSELCTFLDKSAMKRSPLTYSLRMLKTCLVLMEDGTSPGFSLKWTGTGTMQHGRFSIQSTSEFRRTEKDVSLSDILEDEVEEKYYLSDKGGAFVLNPMRIAKKYTQINGDIATAITAKGQSNWTGTFISDGE